MRSFQLYFIPALFAQHKLAVKLAENWMSVSVATWKVSSRQKDAFTKGNIKKRTPILWEIHMMKSKEQAQTRVNILLNQATGIYTHVLKIICICTNFIKHSQRKAEDK